MKCSIKAATPNTSPGGNDGLQLPERDCLIASKRPGLDENVAGSGDKEFPAFGSEEFMNLAHLWCESTCLLRTTALQFSLMFVADRRAAHRTQKARKLEFERSRPRRSPRIKKKVRNGKIRALRGVRSSARIAARMKSRRDDRVA